MSPKCLVIAVALLNLLAGASFGVAIGRASVDTRAVAAVPPSEIDIPALAAVLELPADKDARVRAILTTCRPRCEAVMEELRPKMRALHEKLMAELSVELTPAQMERLVEEYHRRAR